MLNSPDKNLKFTVDLFENEAPNFLDLEISLDEILTLRKDSNTGLYVNYTSFASWTHFNAWIRSLVTHALKICSSNEMSHELKLIKNFATSNDFPKYIVDNIFRKIIQAHEDKSVPNLTAKQKELLVIYFRFPYYKDKV